MEELRRQKVNIMRKANRTFNTIGDRLNYENYDYRKETDRSGLYDSQYEEDCSTLFWDIATGEWITEEEYIEQMYGEE